MIKRNDQAIKNTKEKKSTYINKLVLLITC